MMEFWEGWTIETRLDGTLCSMNEWMNDSVCTTKRPHTIHNLIQYLQDAQQQQQRKTDRLALEWLLYLEKQKKTKND